MNSTWNRATGSIPYQIVFNRKPCYRRIPPAQRPFEQVEFREIDSLDDANDMQSRIEAGELNAREDILSQPDADFRERNEFPELIEAQYVRSRGPPSQTVAGSSRQAPEIDVGDDEDMLQALRESEADELQRRRWAEAERNREINRNMPPIDPTPDDPFLSRPVLQPPPVVQPNRSTNTEIADSQGDPEDDASFHTPPQRGNPSTPPPGPTADALSPSMQRMAINEGNPAELDFIPTIQLRKKVQANQRHVNERAMKQHGKQRNVRVFEIGDQVSVALPDAVRSLTDDTRAFGVVINIHKDLNQYQILTRHGVLDKNVPIDNLNPLVDTIDLMISDPPPTKKINLKQLADLQSMAQKVPVKCDCKARNRYTTRSCRCIQAGVKCSIACHSSMGSHPDIRDPCPNISAMRDFTSRGLASREENAQAKRRRVQAGKEWVGRRAKGWAYVPVEEAEEEELAVRGSGNGSDSDDDMNDRELVRPRPQRQRRAPRK